MSPTLANAALRRSLASSTLRRGLGNSNSVRFASSNAERKAQDTFATAQQTAGKFWESTKNFLDPLGQKLGSMLGSYKEPLLYNAAVARELAKQIYVAERLQPPSMSAIRSAYASIWSQVGSPAALRGVFQSGEVGKIGIYGLQAYGIFKIGEMVGRRNVIGYELH